MEMEFQHLVTTLGSYKEAIVKSLNRIDGSMLDAVNTYNRLNSRNLLANKYNLSIEITEILKKYVKILFLSETLYMDFQSKLDELARVSSPEKGESSLKSSVSNPFLNTSFSFLNHESPSMNEPEPEYVEVKHELSPSMNDPEPEYVEVKHELSDLDTDTDTIVPCKDTDEDILDVKEELEAEAQAQLLTNEISEEVPVKISAESNQQILEISAENDTTPDSLIKSEPMSQESQQDVEDEVIPESSSHNAGGSQSFSNVLEELLSMTVHDRRKELEKKYEFKFVQNFKWRSVPKSQNTVVNQFVKKPRQPCHAIEEDELVAGQKCNFSHVVNPREFYVRTNQELFESLEKSLNDDMNIHKFQIVNKFKSKSEVKSNIGKFCIVFNAGANKWYRSEVIDWMSSDPCKVTVQAIDYGYRYVTRFENLLHMTELYTKFPKLAMRCHFAHLYSPDEVNKDIWPQGSIDALAELSDMENKTLFSVIYVHKEGNSYGVDLTLDGEMTLANILLEMELALLEKVEEPQTPPPPEELVEETIDDEIMAMERCENITELITGYDARDEGRICPFTNSSGRCFKGPSCRLDHAKLSEDGVTTDRVLTVNQPLAELDLPSAGQSIEILVTAYIDICHFYAQIITERSESGNDVKFDNLLDIMNARDAIAGFVPLKLLPSFGEVVITKHGQNYLRGQCKEIINDSFVKVFLVDLGQTVRKALNELWEIQDDFLHLPFLAVECIIDAVREKNGVRKEDSLAFFRKCIHNKHFNAFVIDSNGPLRLKLWDENNMSMDYVLINSELAESRPDDMVPSQNSILKID